ncbi:MAG TPA: MaoC family dehydratase [Pseudonocardia sp.]|jgi:acyl dehydratase|nr:MaoC family dehydratase [Pseudonocardia sp.]
MSSGRFYEQFTVGEIIVHAPSRTVTETDNLLFSALTMNPQPLHLDVEFARTSKYGQILVNGMYTLSLMMGLTVYGTTLGTTAGNLGFKDIDLPNPVFVGDTMTAESEVLAMRESRTKPELGIIEFAHRCRNQRDEIVVACTRNALMLKQPVQERS